MGSQNFDFGMKKVVFLFVVISLVAGCDKKKINTDDLSGTWYVYKMLKNNIDVTNIQPYSDTLQNYRITFTDGKYTECNQFPQDTIPVCTGGNWLFDGYYETITLTDTVFGSRTYTLFNLEGNHVELRRNGINRYLRKL